VKVYQISIEVTLYCRNYPELFKSLKGHADMFLTIGNIDVSADVRVFSCLMSCI
jgi:hypothetical protein